MEYVIVFGNRVRSTAFPDRLTLATSCPSKRWTRERIEEPGHEERSKRDETVWSLDGLNRKKQNPSLFIIVLVFTYFYVCLAYREIVVFII